MENKKEDINGIDVSETAKDGAKRLKISVTKMKKLKSNITAGDSKINDHSTGGVTWRYE